MTRKEKKEQDKTKHHIIGKSLARKYNVHCQKNIKLLSDKRHTALHSLFQTLEPHKQLLELFHVISPVMSDEAKEMMLELIYSDYFYDDDVLF